MRALRVAALYCAVAVLGGCDAGGTSTGSAAGSSTDPSAGAIPCVDQAQPVELPADFPPVLPLPEGTVVTSVEQRSENRTVIDAVAPDEFRTTLAVFQADFPAAGLTLDGGEVEEHDAESEFNGGGYVGRWKLTDLVDCKDTRIELVVAPG